VVFSRWRYCRGKLIIEREQTIMTLLRGDDYFSQPELTVTVERRQPQGVFPEHYHDFFEIVLVEKGAGVHIFNDQPYALTTGTVCFVRASDHHQFDQVDNLRLTNVLYRSPQSFHFLHDVGRFLPTDNDYQQQVHRVLGQSVFQQALACVGELEKQPQSNDPGCIAARESQFLQLVVLLHQACAQGAVSHDSDDRVNQLLQWLQVHFSEEIEWGALADVFGLALRTLHRQVKQHTGMTPQRYLNRLRLLQARHQLYYSDSSITDIAYACGFSDSNHFSTLFRHEFAMSPKSLRQQMRQ
jgi:AraC family L-rhamnose operon regulatory protein RhaS